MRKLATELRQFASAEGVVVELFNRGTFLESYLLANPIVPVLPIPKITDVWSGLLDSVRLSPMTQAMKAACVAQAINESGRGSSRVANTCLNFWGIKMRPELVDLAYGVEVEVTSENSGKATFASFATTDIAVKGWLKFLTRSYYAGWEEHKDDAEEFIKHISKSWCPKPTYADELIKLLPEARKLLGITEMKKRILIDPGHSEREPGARGAGAEEEDLNRLQAQEIAKGLLGIAKVDIYDPEVDDLYDIGDKAASYDIFLSLHHNAYEGYDDPGTECLYSARNAKESSIRLAEKLAVAVSDALGSTNRGAKSKGLAVLSRSESVCNGPCVLMESFFLNKYDMITASTRTKKAANAIVKVLSALV